MLSSSCICIKSLDCELPALGRICILLCVHRRKEHGPIHVMFVAASLSRHSIKNDDQRSDLCLQHHGFKNGVCEQVTVVRSVCSLHEI